MIDLGKMNSCRSTGYWSAMLGGPLPAILPPRWRGGVPSRWRNRAIIAQKTRMSQPAMG